MRKYLLIILFSIIYAVLLSITYKPIWVLTIVSAALIYSVLGNIVAMRRIFFLAGASPHIALLAVTLSIPTYRLIGGYSLIYAVIYGLILIHIAGYFIHRGLQPDVSTATIVGLTTSLSILSIHYVLTHYSVEYSLYSIMLGDPLLIDWFEVFILQATAIVFLTISILTYYEQLSISIDLVSTKLSGLRTIVYDLLTYTLLGVGVVGLIKITGYILEHVLLLIPPSISVLVSKSSREAYLLTIVVAITSSLIGLHFSILLDLPPSGFIGVILLIIYVAALVSKR